MPLKIVQAGEPVLRARARALAPKEIGSKKIRDLVEQMRETMREAPGVGLAAPQIGEPLQLAVIEDRPDYQSNVAEDRLALLERTAVPFHVIINPRITLSDTRGAARFFEGCLSLTGLVGLVARARDVHVDALDDHGRPLSIDARGWYARILQHEIDHLYGALYVDRMYPRTLMTQENHAEFWSDKSIDEIWQVLAADRPPP
jgi:peptide deformylase